MGVYINPNGFNDEAKDAWLETHAKQIPLKELREWTDFKGDELPVVRIYNWSFVACGVIFDEIEKREFLRAYEQGERQFHFFKAKREDILKVSNLGKEGT